MFTALVNNGYQHDFEEKWKSCQVAKALRRTFFFYPLPLDELWRWLLQTWENILTLHKILFRQQGTQEANFPWWK